MDKGIYQIITEKKTKRFVLSPRPRTRGAIVSGIVSCLIGVLAGGAFVVFVWERWLSIFHLELILLTFALGALTRGRNMLAPGSAEVRVRESKLIVIQRVGRSAPVEVELRKVLRLEIETARGFLARVMEQDTQLSAEYADGRREVIVADYPRAWLQALAADLAPLLQEAKDTFLDDDQRASIPALAEVVDVSDIPAVARDVFQPPATSTIVGMEEDGVYTFLVRGRSFVQTRFAYVVFNFGMMLVGLFPLLLVLGLWQTPPAQRPPFTGWLVAIACVVLVAVVAGVIGGFHVFMRKGLLMVSVGENGERSLLHIMRSLLRTRERQWRHDEIAGVSAAHVANANSFKLSYVDKKDAAIFLREVHGKRVKLVDGEEMEMRWLATELRRLLEVGNVR